MRGALESRLSGLRNWLPWSLHLGFIPSDHLSITDSAGKCFTVPDELPLSLKGCWAVVYAVGSPPLGASTPVVPGAWESDG